MSMAETEQAEATPETPALTDLSQREYVEHRLGGKSIDEIVKARTPADVVVEAEATPAPAEAKPDTPRDEAGKFTARPKEGNPRHDPRARIDELTREKSEALRRAEAAEADRERYKAELEAHRRGEGPKPAPVKAAPVERFDDYTTWAAKAENEGKDYDDYRDAREDWKYEQRKAREQSEQQRAEGQKKQTEAVTAFQGRETTFRQATPDYDDVIQRSPVASVPLPSWVIETIVGSDQGPALRYYLAQHPEETTSLASLPPDAALRFLGRLEERLTAASTGSAAAVTPITQAPAPFSPVGAQPTASSRSLETVAKSGSQADYRRLREAAQR